MTTNAPLGRRERKKVERRSEILQCGAALFDEHGFDEVSVRSIADAADVSLRTLYNFFPTKLDILVAVNAQIIEQRMGEALEVLADPPASPAEGVYQLVEAQFRVLDTPDRDLILRLSVHGLSQGPTEGVGREYARLDGLSMDSFRQLMGIYAGRGALGEDADLEGLARFVFAAANGEFFLWVADPDQSVEVPLGHMRKHIALAFHMPAL